MLVQFLLALNKDFEAKENSSSLHQVCDEAFFQELLRGDLQTAKAVCTNMLQRHRNCRNIMAMVVYYLGLVHEKLNEPEMAQKYFRHVAINYPDQPQLHRQASLKLNHSI